MEIESGAAVKRILNHSGTALRRTDGGVGGGVRSSGVHGGGGGSWRPTGW